MQQVGLQCQSCGMPLLSSEVFGTDATGNVVQDYCKYCYEKGEFTQPSFTMDEMIGFCIPFLVEEGMEEKQARELLTNSLPSLKRWSSVEGQPIVPTYSLIQLEEIKLVGIAERTTNKAEMTEQAKIGGLWGRFYGEGIQQSIPNLAHAGPQSIYGCYCDYENGAAGEYTILLGCQVKEINSLPSGMVGRVLPASQYAVFTTKMGPVSTVVIEAWQAIWRWSATSELKRTFTGDFELYDERSSDPENVQVDIYIAVN
ncbi:effector binding domain-containing protein [Cohnella sp. WQ 127256]|uniref:effector binding domain-containing protein n=1 Tax=Cohnella sp. WQ 127256 TaxID=2938790 RepID=UPI002118B195|nr:effector binding domain-containing protein [Cohnella sp. WQ 127256]